MKTTVFPEMRINANADGQVFIVARGSGSTLVKENDYMNVARSIGWSGLDTDIEGAKATVLKCSNKKVTYPAYLKSLIK